ncbi:MAG: hypothetical protein HQK60_04790 [Deltaproteobacteria bacterium]|nr:hypothetical protein [Deltaproteobacteria bacterium]
MINVRLIIIYLSALLLLLFPATATAGEGVVVLQSADIIPYDQAAQGILKVMGAQHTRIISFSGDIDKGRTIIQSLASSSEMVVAVGPEATYLLAVTPNQFKRFFCAVLNPDRILSKGTSYPGVSLNIPPEFQLHVIKTMLPGRKKVAIIHSAERNEHLVAEFQRVASDLGLVIRPFLVNATSEVPEIPDLPDFDADVLLFIPDQLVILEDVVSLVVKKLLFKGIPVVGFNRWFSQNGAVLSFALDYNELGSQCGRLVRDLLQAGQIPGPLVHPPEKVRLIFNERVAQRLKITLPPNGRVKIDEMTP